MYQSCIRSTSAPLSQMTLCQLNLFYILSMICNKWLPSILLTKLNYCESLNHAIHTYPCCWDMQSKSCTSSYLSHDNNCFGRRTRDVFCHMEEVMMVSPNATTWDASSWPISMWEVWRENCSRIRRESLLVHIIVEILTVQMESCRECKDSA